MYFLFLLGITFTKELLADVNKNTFKGKNTFPKLTPYGFEVTNEFQMVIPENIVFSQSIGNYSIISVDPILINNDDVVTVFYHTSNPSSKDWIGAYSPSDVSINSVVPVKYGYCNEVETYLQSGSGYLTFNFTNLRDNISFYYFTG
jgi:hypothetical protein